ncbi:MAG: hypothetical protein Q8941_24565 [Bacteroidota bacterium]|nr:hypothetical protein [Bacteroidota bacterium]
MILTSDQIATIIKTNPNKKRIDAAKEVTKKLMRHIHGTDMLTAVNIIDFFEGSDIFKVRKASTTSNKDMFGRLLQAEDMVFNAKGGSKFFNLPETSEKQMHAVLDSVRYGLSLRKWIKVFALEAYRADPMGVIFMEVEQLVVIEGQPANTPKVYPTYKSIFSVFDYDNTGRQLDYVVFNLTPDDLKQFGIQAPDNAPMIGESNSTGYYRVVDDTSDTIIRMGDGGITEVNRMEHSWQQTPAFIVSDLVQFDNPKSYLSPLNLCIELADTFFEDRSVRNLQKKFHGFSKAFEPLMKCGTCNGSGQLKGQPCPSCTVAGAEMGTGYKLQTRVSDVARFPLSMFEASGGFDVKKIFGYITPDIQGWDKQDLSLEQLESLINYTYWGSAPDDKSNGTLTTRTIKNPSSETATKTKANLQPRYARLNQIADWAEGTESLIADFIGKFWFGDAYDTANISYGRYYILESPDDLMTQYQDLLTGGAPISAMYEALEKYYHSVYENSPIELAVRLKLLYVEPFPHLSIAEAKNLVSDFTEYNRKLYFGEWYATLQDAYVINTDTIKLRQDLTDYVAAKKLTAPAAPVPAFGGNN